MDSDKSKKIITELESIVLKPGSLYVLATLVRQDLYLDSNGFIETNWMERASHNEISFLLGLAIKSKFNGKKKLSSWRIRVRIRRIKKLLKELHYEQGRQMMHDVHPNYAEETSQKDLEIRLIGDAVNIEEAIFYGASGAYDFQYLNFSEDLYAKDSKWLAENGIDIDLFIMYGYCIKKIALERANVKKTIFKNRAKHNLDIMSFTPKDIMTEAIRVYNKPKYKPERFTLETAEKFIQRFACVPGETNSGYKRPGTYNTVDTHPFLSLGGDKYFLPMPFSLAQSLYESPAYWMRQDKAYLNSASKNRGESIENITAGLVKRVFGEENVYESIKIEKSGKTVTDMDVLALYGSKAVIFQCKSKRLTLLSRQGNEDSLRDDFSKAIQSAYDQALISREALLNKSSYKFIDRDKKEFKFTNKINDVYLIPVTAENYPAVLTQVEYYLAKEKTDPWPIPLSIPDLELTVTYLDDPYKFLLYFQLRAKYADKIKSPNEMALLAFHLRHNLYINDETSLMMIDQSEAQYIDADIMHQAENAAKPNEDQQLKNSWRNDTFEKIVDDIKKQSDDFNVDIVLMLRQISSSTVDEIIEMIKSSRTLALTDHGSHDLSVSMENRLGGLTIAVGIDSQHSSRVMEFLSMKNKYITKSNSWIGLVLNASDLSVETMSFDDKPWKKDKMTETSISNFKILQNHSTKHNRGKPKKRKRR